MSLRDIRLKAGETEHDYNTRLREAAVRCGNVHNSKDLATIFVDGLDPSIKTLVVRHREAHRKTNYLELLQFARYEGDAFRARQVSARKPPLLVPQKGHKNAPRANLMLQQSPPGTPSPSIHNGTPATNYDGVNLMQDGYQAYYASSSSDIPSTSQQTEYHSLPADPALAAGDRMVPPQKVAFEKDTRTLNRPGWVDRRPGFHGHRNNFQPRRGHLICHACYKLGHVAPDCLLPLKEQHKVISNFEALSEKQRDTVPMTSYLRAKAQFTPEGQYVPLKATTSDPVGVTESRHNTMTPSTDYGSDLKE